MSESIVDTVINRISNAAAENIPEADDFIDEDGFLRCGKCHSRKELFVPGIGRVYKLCDCAQVKVMLEADAEKKKAQAKRMQKRRELAFDNALSSMKDCTFQNDNGTCPEMEKIRAYAENWLEMKANNSGLLLWGNVGSGKSYAAACIANALIDKGATVRMRNLSYILNELFNAEDKNTVIKEYARCDLLIIDDFGMERKTEYALEQVFNIIDARYNAGLPLIITTNLPLKEITESEDIDKRRVYSRILEMCTPLKFHGNDQRRDIALSKLEKARKILGTWN